MEVKNINERTYVPMAMLKSCKNTGIALIPTIKLQENLEGLRKQSGVVKLLPLYNNLIRNEARSAFKKHYKSIGYNYKIIDNNDLLVQITTKNRDNQYHFHQYYIIPVRLSEIKEG